MEVPHSNIRRKEIRAFRKLFFKFHGRLVLFANKLTGNIQVSQDLVQDAFMKLWEKYQDNTEIDIPKAYLFKAVRNSCLNYQRHLSNKYKAEEKIVLKL